MPISTPFFPIYSDLIPTRELPVTYLIDLKWPESPLRRLRYRLSAGSLFNELNQDVNCHGLKTLTVIFDIVPSLTRARIRLASAERKTISEFAPYQFLINVSEAIESIQFDSPKPGSVVMLNMADGDDSFFYDELIVYQLKQLCVQGCVVIVSAANNCKKFEINRPDPDILLVASYDDALKVNSNYGSDVTIYLPGNMALSGPLLAACPHEEGFEGVQYQNSSAAAAQLTGIVLLMQAFAKIKTRQKRYLTSAETKRLLQDKGMRLADPDAADCSAKVTGSPFTWLELKTAIEHLLR